MTLFTKPGVAIASPVTSGGIARPVDNLDMQVWMTEVETVVKAFTSSGGLVYDTRANLYADLAHDANTQAWVIADSTVAYNGIYRKAGASGEGSWSRVADLPYTWIAATDAGAGTANAIVATTLVPLPSVDRAALISLNIYRTNTGSPVTVAFNGGSPLTIADPIGNDMTAGGLTEGAVVAGYIESGMFRILIGLRGWSPVLRLASDGARRVLELYDWTGGQGGKPTTTGYLGASGLAVAIEDAVDLRGPVGLSGDGSGDMVAANYDPNGRIADIFDPANHWHKVPHASSYLRKTSDRIDHDNRWSLFDFIDPAQHADIRDQSTLADLTDEFHSAFDSGEALALPRGLFLVEGLTGVAGLNMRGVDWNSIIKLADGSNAIVMSFTDTSAVWLESFVVDGNKAGQTTTTSHRGIYFLANAAHVDDLFLSGLLVKDTGGQGIMMSGPGAYKCGRNALVEWCRAVDTGHTGFNGGCSIPGYATMWFNCLSLRPALQGFKTGGDHISCEVEGDYSDSGQGEGFETEYFADADQGVITYAACHVRGAGNGWRLNGTNHIVRMRDCTAEEIETSVVTAFGNINELHINGLTGKNFGKRGNRDGGTTGLDLVTLIDVSTADPAKAFLHNLVGKDTQETPTGEYLVYAPDTFREIAIGGNNEARDLKEGAFNFGIATDADVTIRGYTRGWTAEHSSESSTVVGGSAGTYDLKTHTIKRREIRMGTTVEFEERVSFSGTNGTKEVKFQLNAETAISLGNWTSGETDTMTVRGRLWFPSASVVILQLDMITKGTTVATPIHRAYSISSGTDIAIKLTAVMGGTDTATQAYLKISGRR